MKKTATTEIINRIDYLLNTIDKLVEEEKYNKANKLQEEFNKIEEEYNLFDQIYEENGKKGVKDIAGKILIPAIYSDYSECYSYTFKREAPMAAKNDKGKYALVSTDGKGTPLCDFKYDFITFKPYTDLYTCCINTDEGKHKLGLLTYNGEEIVPCEMDTIYGISNCIISFEKGDKYGLITCWGLYVPPIYDEMEEDEDEWVHVKLNGQWGHISEDGNFIPDEDEETFDDTICLSFGIID